MNSAYRPQEYQDHLREIWDKWSLLKDSNEEVCREIKKVVESEFTFHKLLGSQRPAVVSNHSRGEAAIPQ